MKKQFYNLEEISDYLTLSTSSVYKKVANNEIPYHKVGSRTLFDVDEINLWVRNNGELGQRNEVSFLDVKSFLD